MSSCWWWWWHGGSVPICGVVTRQCDGACNKTPIKMWAAELRRWDGGDRDTEISPPGAVAAITVPLTTQPCPAYDTLTRSPAAPELCSTPGVITGHQGLTWFRLTRVRTRVFSIILTSFLVLYWMESRIKWMEIQRRKDWFNSYSQIIHQSIMIEIEVWEFLKG